MPRIRRSEKTRENLITEGINLLTEHGYHGTGLKLILDTVKVPKGSFYNYFESKEHFVAEILDTYAQQLLNEYDEYVAKSSNESPLQLISKIYQHMLDTLDADGQVKGCLIGNMAAEIGSHSELCRQSMQRTLQQWRTRLLALLEMGQQQGQVRNDISAESLGDLLWCTWEGSLLRMKIEGHSNTVRSTLSLLLEQLFVTAPQETQAMA